VQGYELVLSEAAAMTLVTAPRSAQRKLALILDNVKKTPFRTGDLQEQDTQGRINEVIVAGDWLVTFWPDHAVRKLRIIRLEHVED
jgi:hypothetical protein